MALVSHVPLAGHPGHGKPSAYLKSKEATQCSDLSQVLKIKSLASRCWTIMHGLSKEQTDRQPVLWFSSGFPPALFLDHQCGRALKFLLHRSNLKVPISKSPGYLMSWIGGWHSISPKGSYGGGRRRSHFLLCLPWSWLTLVLLRSLQHLFSKVFLFGL